MGIALATLFPPLHEAGHRTAFASRRLNELVLWIRALAMLQAPTRAVALRSAALARARVRLEHANPGYLAFHREALARAFRLRAS